ncbi:MAG: ABC transporter ATP-binding protein [Bacteroidales bacterium]|nr:ABC transporter ATP-binding protein [Bacteroidales bacterium]
MSEVLTTQSLSIGYTKQKPLVSNLNLTLHSGALTILTGENGTGKSTLLKTITKIIKPLDGKIFIKGIDLSQISAAQMAEKAAVVLTDRLSSENFTALEVISFGRSPYTGFFGRLTQKDYSIIKGVAEDLKIEPLLNLNFYELSDGQKQKVLIAKALAQQTEIIILDEPTAFLDFKAKDEIFALLKKIAAGKNIAILVSTHDIYQAAKYGNEFWVMENNDITVTKNNPYFSVTNPSSEILGQLS